MAVFAQPTQSQLTCRGKAGKSKPHPHYGGRPVGVKEGWVARCSSCGEIVLMRRSSRDPNQGSSAGYQVVPAVDLPALAFAVMGAVL